MIIRNLCLLAAAGALCVIGASRAAGDNDTRKEPTAHPPLFTSPLTDVPGKHLVVVALQFDAQSAKHFMPHYHPGSVYVYVTKGTARLGVEGQPPQLVHAGESFFEPVGAHHTVAESASPTEPATAIAVMIVPDGAPLVSTDAPKK